MHNRKGGGKLEDLQAELVALDAKAKRDGKLGTMPYGMARQDLVAQIAKFDTPEVKAQKQKEFDAQKAKDSAHLASWVATSKVLDDAQAQREKEYQDRFVLVPGKGWRLKKPGE
jgi:hypothetical protein